MDLYSNSGSAIYLLNLSFITLTMSARFSVYRSRNIMFTYETCTIFTIITTLIIIAFKLIFEKVTKKSKYVVKDEKKKIPIGFYLGVSNIIMLIYTNFLIFYVVK